jgi:hypothetical protein
VDRTGSDGEMAQQTYSKSSYPSEPFQPREIWRQMNIFRVRFGHRTRDEAFERRQRPSKRPRMPQNVSICSTRSLAWLTGQSQEGTFSCAVHDAWCPSIGSLSDVCVVLVVPRFAGRDGKQMRPCAAACNLRAGIVDRS